MYNARKRENIYAYLHKIALNNFMTIGERTMSSYTYKTTGTCSSQINIELDGTIIENIAFTGGCNGNLQGIANITRGMDANDVITRFSGIKCGPRATSCPDQLSKALKEALAAKH